MKKNPFVPGSGMVPAHLAGRAAEQRILQNQLDYLTPDSGAPSEVVMVGPRGNGKTALLRWFEKYIHDTARQMDVAWLTPDDIPGTNALAEEVAPAAYWREWLPDEVSIKVLGTGGRVRWELDGSSGNLTRLLTARCRKRPLVVLLDEAHTLEPDIGRGLLNLSQKVRAKAPFLLALAGTPQLQAHLNAMGASFWNRCERLGIGLLDSTATAEALAVPLAQHGFTCTATALDAVVVDSQRYPYFIQLWGQALWQVAQDQPDSRLDTPHVVAARPSVEAKKQDYYEDRFDELIRADAVTAAQALAAAFIELSDTSPRLPERQVDQVLANLVGMPLYGADVPAEVLALQDTLQALGYIWKPPGQVSTEKYWEPGIPSLMDYVQARKNVSF